jgi:hypothetical protein
MPLSASDCVALVQQKNTHLGQDCAAAKESLIDDVQETISQIRRLYGGIAPAATHIADLCRRFRIECVDTAKSPPRTRLKQHRHAELAIDVRVTIDVSRSLAGHTVACERIFS